MGRFFGRPELHQNAAVRSGSFQTSRCAALAIKHGPCEARRRTNSAWAGGVGLGYCQIYWRASRASPMGTGAKAWHGLLHFPTIGAGGFHHERGKLPSLVIHRATRAVDNLKN